MAEDPRAAAVQAFVAEFNGGDPGSVGRFIAPEFFTHVPGPDEPSATDVVHALASDIRAAFPDLTIALHELTAEGGGLSGRATLAGTDTGPLWGAPATGKHLAWTVSFRLREVDGRFAVNLDDVTPQIAVGLLRDLELVNPPDKMDQPPRHPFAIPDVILKLAFTGQAGDKPCGHLQDIRFTEPATDTCEQCLVLGDVWPALRMCLVCGFVGCCDTSKNKHMKQHYEASGHPIFRSIRLEEGWIWCYEDDAFFERRTLDRVRHRDRP